MKPSGIDRDLDPTDPVEAVEPEDPFAHWLPTYARARSFDENAHSLAKSLWGHAFADWTWCLANEVAAKFPEAIEHDQSPGWVAGVLWAAAVEAGMRGTDTLWDHIRDDIAEMTGVDQEIAQQRWEDLKAAGLDRPVHPPVYWD